METQVEPHSGKKSWTEYVSGTCKWCRVHVPNQYGDFKLDFYPDGPSLTKIMGWKARGLKNVIRQDDDGTVIAFKRASSKVIRNKVVGFAAPEIVDKEGKPASGVQIGNGSSVTLRLNLYTYRGPDPSSASKLAARLEAIRIDNLVPFNKIDDRSEDTKTQLGKLDEQPVPSYNF